MIAAATSTAIPLPHTKACFIVSVQDYGMPKTARYCPDLEYLKQLRSPDTDKCIQIVYT